MASFTPLPLYPRYPLDRRLLHQQTHVALVSLGRTSLFRDSGDGRLAVVCVLLMTSKGRNVILRTVGTGILTIEGDGRARPCQPSSAMLRGCRLS
jgi:hypothetical protein